MIKNLIINQWHESIRSIAWQRNVASNVGMGIVLGLLFLNLLGIGLLIDQILVQINPDEDPVQLFNRILLYYLGIDLILRYFLQRVPGVAIRPYLYLPLKRSLLVHYLLAQSSLSLFNLKPLLIFVPFAFKVVGFEVSLTAACAWLVSIGSLMLINSFLNFYFKKKLITNPLLVGGWFVLLIVVVLLEYFKVISLLEISADFFDYFVQYPWLAGGPVLGLLTLYWVNYRFMKAHLYLEALQISQPGSKLSAKNLHWLGYFGETGQYIALELKLIFRNKRPRTLIFFPALIILCGFLIYGQIPIDPEDFYPQPKPVTAHFSTQANLTENIASTTSRVTFKVIPEQLPATAHIYVAGSGEKLGQWRPNRVPLRQNPDSSWARTFVFEKGSILKYKFTLGSWETQRLSSTGDIPAEYALTVQNDTTVVSHAVRWDVPRRPFILDFNLIYFGLLMTGMFMLAYGQFIFSWESSYFDTLLSKRVQFSKYFNAKWNLLLVSCGIFYLLTLPFALYGKNLFLINTVLFVYNGGINTFILLFMVTYNRKRMDLNASILSNQGKGGVQYLTILPTLILPILIFIPFWIIDQPNTGYLMFGVLGGLGLVFHQPILKLLVHQFYRQKYKMAAGFRTQ